MLFKIPNFFSLTPLNLRYSEQYLSFNPILSPPFPSFSLLGEVGEVRGLVRSKGETNNYDIKLIL